MSIFQLGRKTVSFRGKDFTVRELSAAEREAAKKVSAEKGVPFLYQVVFQQTDWPEDAKMPTVGALGEEPMALLETLVAEIFRMSGIAGDFEEKKAD